MLLSSLLTILSQDQLKADYEQPKPRAPEPRVAPPEGSSGLDRIEEEIALAAGLLKSPNAMPQSASPHPSPFMEELLRAINKFEQSDQAPVVDFFE